ncbi:hypothetical protein ABZ260_33250 [Streptosporangium sp. NPDC006013]|uniref:hypothetical protein n=1 Tax=Streptosporangium sp. NPDC006013 TaxID=3155596 RepID=UPI0033A3E2DE
MSGDEPRFGYGRGRRPLWSERDRDAERVRDALRGAGLAEFGEDQDGFVVESGETGQPFAVAFTGPEVDAEEEFRTYTAGLRSAGMRAEQDPDDSQALQVLSESERLADGEGDAVKGPHSPVFAGRS